MENPRSEEIVCTITGGLLPGKRRISMDQEVEGDPKGLAELSQHLVVLKGLVNASLTKLVEEERTTANNNSLGEIETLPVEESNEESSNPGKFI